MRASVLLISVAIAVSGCATSPASFRNNKYTIGDTRLCRTFASAQEGDDAQFLSDVADEVARRGLGVEACGQLVRNQNIGVGVAAVVGAVLVAAARKGGGGGGAAGDSQWDWDLYNNAYGQPTWSCRGVQTGQFAELWHCNGLVKTDYRWPGPNLR